MDIQSLTIEPNNILVINAPSHSHAASLVADAVAVQRVTGAAAVVVLEPGQSIESLDDAALRRAGLRRIVADMGQFEKPAEAKAEPAAPAPAEGEPAQATTEAE